MSPQFIERVSDWTGLAAVWLTAFAALFGCIFWYFSGLDAKAKKSELEKFKKSADARIAKSQEETMKAKLELEQLHKTVDPRRLSGIQKETLVKFLNDNPSTVVILSCLMDGEGEDFANDFDSAFREANWRTRRCNDHVGMDRGVFLGTYEGGPTFDEEIRRISDALTSIGVAHARRIFTTKEKNSITLEFQTGVVYLFIARKPDVTPRQ
jgi:hypothetical protein